MLRLTMEQVEEQSWELTEKRGTSLPGAAEEEQTDKPSSFSAVLSMGLSSPSAAGVVGEGEGGGLLRSRAGAGLIWAGEGLIRAGAGLIWAGEGLIRAGAGLIRAGEAKPESVSNQTWMAEAPLEPKVCPFS